MKGHQPHAAAEYGLAEGWIVARWHNERIPWGIHEFQQPGQQGLKGIPRQTTKLGQALPSNQTP